MDYKYTEFVEHTCGSNSSQTAIYTYFENGNIESYTSCSKSNGVTIRQEYFYDSTGIKLSQKFFQEDKLYYEYEFYPNGKNKRYLLYNINITPSYLSNTTTYYENGKEEYRISYSANGVETSKTYYTYYSNGNKKTEDDFSNGIITRSSTYYPSGNTKTYDSYSKGIIDDSYIYYDNSTKTVKTYLDYNSSGYMQYYYTDSGYLYTYADGKTTSSSTNSSVYSAKTAYTASQAATKLAELRNN